LDPKERLTAEKALRHDFFSSATDNCLEHLNYPIVPPKPIDPALQSAILDDIAQRAHKVKEKLGVAI